MIEWDDFVDEYIEGHLAANPDMAVYLGRHEFDGRIPDWSRAGLEAELKRLRDARDRALAFDTTALDGARRHQRAYLLAIVDYLHGTTGRFRTRQPPAAGGLCSQAHGCLSDIRDEPSSGVTSSGLLPRT